MSHLIPPFLNSTPPPIVEDDEDDEEFGNFTAASNSYDCEDLSLPSSPHKISDEEFKTTLDINSNNSQNVTTDLQLPTDNRLNEVFDKNFQDKRKDIDEENSREQVCSEEVESQITLENGFCECKDSINVEDDIEPLNNEEHCNDTEDEISYVSNKDLDGPIVLNCDKSNSNLDSLSGSIDEKSYCEVSPNSQEIELKVDPDENLQDSKTKCDNLTEEHTIEEDSNSDDDFGNFANFDDEINKQSQDSDNFIDDLPTEEIDDDFGDFESSKNSVLIDINENNAAEQCESIVKTIFPLVNENNNLFNYADENDGNQVFEELKDVTETCAMNYQWSKSSSQKMFLKSLNIDTRNILYRPVWNTSMPKFAATLGLAPLEPVKTDTLVPTAVQSTPSPSNSSQKNNGDIPTAQFDWSDSGLVNPLDSTSNDSPTIVPEDTSPTQMSTIFFPEAPTTPTLPSLFDHQTVEKNTSHKVNGVMLNNYTDVEIPKLVPLRETHISNDLNEPGWLHPTILTPDLPRKEAVNIEDLEDEFDDFQMVLPEEKKVDCEETGSLSVHYNGLTNSTVETNHIINNCSVNDINIKEDNDEFSEFYFSASVESEPRSLNTISLEPLKPTVQYTAPTSINWPEPGVSEDDIKNIELNYSRTVDTIEQKTNQNEMNNKHLDDDGWSDFMSVKTERTATPDLPLSVLNLNNVQAPKKPIPVITPSGLVQTKLSSNIKIQPKSVVQTSIKPSFYKMSGNHPQPSTVSQEFATSFCTTQEDDDWGDFISSQPVPQQKNCSNSRGTGSPNIIMNPTHYEAFTGFGSNDNRNMTSISSISALPDLDFIAPKNRTNKK